jgi:hypothetical protein
LPAIGEAGVFGKGVDCAQRACLHQQPFDVGRILFRQGQLAAKVYLGKIANIAFLHLHNLRGDALGRRGPAPHPQGTRNLLVVGENSRRRGHAVVQDFEVRAFDVPGQRHRPVANLRDAIGGRLHQLHTAEAGLQHRALQVFGSCMKAGKGEVAVARVDIPQDAHGVAGSIPATNLFDHGLETGLRVRRQRRPHQ